MPFKRFVETGRVAYISDGANKGKLCAIVDVINPTKALIDGPETGVPRGAIRLNQLHLTKFRIRFPFTAGTRVVRKAWKDAEMDTKWKNSIWAKKVENKKKRAGLTDFDRFKLRRVKTIRNKVRSKVFFKLRKQKKIEDQKSKKPDGQSPKKEKKPAAEKKKEAKKQPPKK